MNENKLKERILVKNSSGGGGIFRVDPPLPSKNMLIEINNHCNHKCIFCSNRKMTRKKGFIDNEFLTKILNEAYQNGVREVGYYSTGEPFLNPSLSNHIKIAKDVGFEYIYLTTNGALAEIDKVECCIANGLNSIKFSINGYDRKSYKLIHGVDDFNCVINNIREVYNFKKKNNLDFNLFSSTILTKVTSDHKSDFKILLNDLVDEQIFIPVRNQGGLISDIFSSLTVASNVMEVSNCIFPFSTINITYEGYLTACCSDFNNYLVVADLNKTSLLDAWNCVKMKNLRQKIIERNLTGTMCHNCYNNSTGEFFPIDDDFYYQFDFNKIFNDNEFQQRKLEIDN